MFHALLVAAAASANWLPAAPDELDTFARHADATTTVGGRADGRLYAVHVGTAGDKVAFLVIALGPPDGKPFTSPVRSWANPRKEPNGTTVRNAEAFLDLPGGGKVRLPLRRQLVEVADGKVRFSDRRVSAAEVSAYLGSKPGRCSLDDLLRFVDDPRNKLAK
jgi:hypothetical protein